MPAKYKEPDGYRLGGWVKKQRSVYKRGKLLPERKTRLESVEGWAWELTVTGQLPGESWEEGFKRLQRYVEEHKTIPKQSYREPDGYRLGRWVTKQRSKGNRGKLTPERKARLESVEGWVWDASFLKSSKNR